jgi:hypothetical protein
MDRLAIEQDGANTAIAGLATNFDAVIAVAA